MSGIINKVKEALHHGDNSSTSTSGTHSTTGTHTTGTHTTGTHTGTAEGVAGPHGSRVANAADPRVDSDLDGSRNAGAHSTGTHHTTGTTGTTGTHTGTSEGIAGPHNSRIANAADPRVDSDLDGSRNAGAHSTGTHSGYGTGAHSTGTGLTGSTGTHTGTSEGIAGPHGSRVANAADPRVDSDLDGSRNAGAHSTGTHSGYGTGAHSSTTGSGPIHQSNTANKLDPRVDSDLDGSRNLGATQTHGNTSSTTGYGSTGGVHGTGAHTSHSTTTGSYPTTGSTGGISHSTNAGPHDSALANKADPRVDSDLDGRGNRHGASTGGILGASGSHATPGSGTAQNTAGPHNSDLLNKADPRVDSDANGSKTYGGNKTHT